ncbi:MAG: ArsR/SmtB family transcription factor [Propionibacteriaceae bacterium]
MSTSTPLSGRSAPLYRIKADLFKSLGHPTRIQVLEVLAAAEDQTVGVRALLATLDAEPSHLSQHLAVLKHAGVVSSTRTGNLVAYRLSQPLVAELLVVARAFLRSQLSDASEQLAAADELPPLGRTAPAGRA